MSSVYFIVHLHDGPYKCVLSLRNSKFHAICDNIGADDTEQCTAAAGKSVTPNQIVYLLREFDQMHTLHRRVYRFLRQFNAIVRFTVIEPPNGNLIDYAWCHRATVITWEKVEVDNLMSWLSTLGGAFSALGDSFDACAERAARISFYQLKLAMKSGNPSIIARCKLYYSISLIQKGQLGAAKHLVLKQYEWAKKEMAAGEPLLYKMCHGIWLKLQYTHQMRKERRALKNTQNSPVNFRYSNKTQIK